jgi:hypothetical protein
LFVALPLLVWGSWNSNTLIASSLCFLRFRTMVIISSRVGIFHIVV